MRKLSTKDGKNRSEGDQFSKYGQSLAPSIDRPLPSSSSSQLHRHRNHKLLLALPPSTNSPDA
eukprot:CAMPEP_0181106100 /NCGR_PEP_ID=MMETSP1071-20121207/16350_1 /TAXON_ID=35127 /ORGANISM="Thalassiosira sp., Strain NH16" /LENGTH=62 /DNA_ID=CAMNT_0023189481 /DNA_START=27 /DNA_END=211 /DNA_ORIENTATION=+